MVFIGADPCTAWLAATVALDSGGYVRTGPTPFPGDWERAEGRAATRAAGDERRGRLRGTR
jgi:thioredoxin reductase (NADPH)